MPECNNETRISSEGFSRLCVMSEAEHPPITAGVIIIPQGFKERGREREEGGEREGERDRRKCGGGGGTGGLEGGCRNRQLEWEL